MSSIEKRLIAIEQKVDLLLSRYGASEKPTDAKPGRNKVPVKRQTKAVKMADYETMYRKKGIV